MLTKSKVATYVVSTETLSTVRQCESLFEPELFPPELFPPELFPPVLFPPVLFPPELFPLPAPPSESSVESLHPSLSASVEFVEIHPSSPFGQES